MDDAPKLDERRKLTVNKSGRQTAATDTPTTPVHRPIRKTDSDSGFAMVMAIICSVFVFGGGYLGFKHLHEQVQRISQIEAEKTATEREAQKQEDQLHRLEAKLQQIASHAEAEKESQKRALIAKLTAENETAMSILRNQVEQAKLGAEAALAALKEKQHRLTTKLDQIEQENKDMKVWLRTHNTTLHPNY